MQRQFTVIIKQDKGLKNLFATIYYIKKQKVSNRIVQILVLKPGKKIDSNRIKGQWVTVLQAGQKWTEESFREVLRISQNYGENLAFIMQGKADGEKIDVCAKALSSFQDNPAKYFIHRKYMRDILLIANAHKIAEWKEGLLQLFMEDTLMVRTNAVTSVTKYNYENEKDFFLDGIFDIRKRMTAGENSVPDNLTGQVGWMIQLLGVLKKEPESILNKEEMEIFRKCLKEALATMNDYAIYNGLPSGIMRRYAFEVKYGKEEFARQLENRNGEFFFHNLKVCDMNRVQADKGIPLKYDTYIEQEDSTRFFGTIFCNLPMEFTQFYLVDEDSKFEIKLDETTGRVQKCAGENVRQEYKFHCDVPRGQRFNQYRVMCIYNKKEKIMLNV